MCGVGVCVWCVCVCVVCVWGVWCVVCACACVCVCVCAFFHMLAHISYGRFIAIRYNFKLSTYVQEPLVIGRRGCVQREV